MIDLRLPLSMLSCALLCLIGCGEPASSSPSKPLLERSAKVDRPPTRAQTKTSKPAAPDCASVELREGTTDRLREIGQAVAAVQLLSKVVQTGVFTAQISTITGGFVRLPKLADVFELLFEHARSELRGELARKLKPVDRLLETWDSLPQRADRLEQALRNDDVVAIQREASASARALKSADRLFRLLRFGLQRLERHAEVGHLTVAVDDYESEIDADLRQLEALAECAPDPGDAGDDAPAEVGDWMVQLSSKANLDDAIELDRQLRRELGANANRARIIRHKRREYYCNVIDLSAWPDDDEIAVYEVMLGEGGFRRETSNFCACPTVRDEGRVQVVYCHHPAEC